MARVPDRRLQPSIVIGVDGDPTSTGPRETVSLTECCHRGARAAHRCGGRVIAADGHKIHKEDGVFVLKKTTELIGCAIHATDGTIGSVTTILFDDEAWTLRYLVVDTGTWLPGRKVLIAPMAIRKANWKDSTVEVSLTREQVKNSPDIDTDSPVSRQREQEFYSYYSYPYYWTGVALPMPPSDQGAKFQDSHLRDARVVKGYHIRATDGEIGHVEDFLLDPKSWTIRYMIVDTSNWLGGRRVLIAPSWVRAVSWADAEVHVDASRQVITDSPDYDVAVRVSRTYEQRLYAHYGTTGYWSPRRVAADRRARRAAERDRLSRLDELREFEVSGGDPDVRGWNVLASDGLPIGTVEHLIVDRAAKKVRYLEVGLGGEAAGSGHRDVLVPLEYVDLDKAKDEVRLRMMPVARIATLPTFVGLPIDPAEEQRLQAAFGVRSSERQSF